MIQSVNFLNYTLQGTITLDVIGLENVSVTYDVTFLNAEYEMFSIGQ